MNHQKPKPDPNNPAANILNSFAYSERPHSPKRERVATKDLPRYDLSRQKAHTYSRLNDIITKKFDGEPLIEEVQKVSAKSSTWLQAEAAHYTRKADALSSRRQSSRHQ